MIRRRQTKAKDSWLQDSSHHVHRSLRVYALVRLSLSPTWILLPEVILRFGLWHRRSSGIREDNDRISFPVVCSVAYGARVSSRTDVSLILSLSAAFPVFVDIHNLHLLEGSRDRKSLNELRC